MKPRIFREERKIFDGLCCKYWRCSDGDATGIGASPMHAYASWKENRDYLFRNRLDAFSTIRKPMPYQLPGQMGE